MTNRLVISSNDLTSDTNIQRLNEYYNKNREKKQNRMKKENKNDSFIFKEIKTDEVIEQFNKVSTTYNCSKIKSKLHGIPLKKEHTSTKEDQSSKEKKIIIF